MPIPEPFRPNPEAQMLLMLAAQDLRPLRHLGGTYCPTVREERALAARAFTRIQSDLIASDYAYAHIILEKSAEAREDPIQVVVLTRLLRALSLNEPRLRSIPLRTIAEEIALKLGIGRHLHVWLSESDNKLRAFIQELPRTIDKEKLLRVFDAEAARIGIPRAFWWEYPAEHAFAPEPPSSSS